MSSDANMAEQKGTSPPQTNGVTVPIANGSTSSYAAKHDIAAHFIGSNHLHAAAQGPVKEFVANNDGHTVITSVSWNT